MRTDILLRKDEILSWIEEELTITEMKNRLCCKTDTLKRYFKQMGIDYKGQQFKKSAQNAINKYKPSSCYTYKGAPAIASAVLREKLIRDGIKEAKCEKCGNTHWLGIKLPLELHHKDEDHFNNELSNLEILCPNCHAVSGTGSARAVTKKYKERIEKQLAVEKYKTEKLEKLHLERANKLATGVKLDASGKFNHNILEEEVWLARKNQILDSGVDLTKYGWKTKIQKVTGLTRRQVDLTIERFTDAFDKKVYIRN